MERIEREPVLCTGPNPEIVYGKAQLRVGVFLFLGRAFFAQCAAEGGRQKGVGHLLSFSVTSW